MEQASGTVKTRDDIQVSEIDDGIEKSNESLVADASELAFVYREHK